MKKYINYFRPKLGESWLIMLAIMLVGGSILSLVIMGIINLIQPGTIDMLQGDGWSTLIMYPLPFVVVLFYIYLRSRSNYTTASVQGIPPYPTYKVQLGRVPVILFLLCLVLLIASLNVLVDPLVSWLEMPESMQKILGSLTETNFPTFVSVVIAAPICEEWLLRGVALKGMLEHMSPWKAIIWSAVMFGVIHGNPWQAIPAIILGSLFGWVYYRTRSYWSCVGLHAINNGSSFLLAAIFPEITPDMSLYEFLGPNVFYICFAVSVVIFVGVIWYLYTHLSYPVPKPTPQPIPIETIDNER